MAHIEGVNGNQYLPTDVGYDTATQQYASSTYQIERDLDPGLVVMAASMNDIIRAVIGARESKRAIAVRTGGHQYSGASSTSRGNIQLDLSTTFKNKPDDLQVIPSPAGAEDVTLVRTSVSWSLGEFLHFLTENHLFVPTGQCTDVHLGGHVQTGGYGQLARSFGLLGDHVRSLQIVDSDGVIRDINKGNDPDLFFALLGGSPGNLGVITHFVFEAQRDSDYTGSMGMQAYYLYTPQKLQALMEILTEMSDSDTIPRNYDLCVTVQSQHWKLGAFDMDLFTNLKNSIPGLFDPAGNPIFAGIAVYAQWVKLTPTDTVDMDFFRRLDTAGLPLITKGPKVMEMSQMVHWWLFTAKREFDKPYVKRTLLTPSNTLSADNFPAEIIKHVDKICLPWNGLYVSMQLQCFGGQFSRFRTNALSGDTSYSWRADSRFGGTIDCFHDDDASHKQAAEDWQTETDTMIGPEGVFAKQERRLLWGSHGDWDMRNVWQFYYDSESLYERLQGIRKTADKYGTFTANPFCVPRAE